MSTATAKKTFKSFLVESLDSRPAFRNIFRIIEMTGGVTRKQAEKLIESLPISFSLRQEDSNGPGDINEPLETYVNGAIVSIYPPRERIIRRTCFRSRESADVVSRMHIDNVMDMDSPGRGQIRTCVHFDPKIFGIEGWPDTEGDELELDIHVYPRTKTEEPKLKAPSFGKFKVMDLFNLISGGKGRLTVEQFRRWHELIMYAVESMRANYENPDVAADYSVRPYYQPCWKEFEAAGQNDEKLVEALEHLWGMIEQE